jgi:SnoaL-like domain
MKPSLEQRLAIEDLVIRYTTALDAGEIDGVVDCFVADGWLDSPIVGRHEGPEGLRAFARKNADAIHARGVRLRHFVSNFRVEMLDEKRGRVRCYLLDYATRDGVAELLSPGEYECEVVLTDGEWRFVSRIVRMDRAFPMP